MNGYDRIVVATQPHTLVDDSGKIIEDYYGPAYQFDEYLAKTNYVGCGGAHSGGQTPDPDRAQYTGVMSCRDRFSFAQIGDGTTHTIMYGENIGQVDKGNLAFENCWFFGGLIRGRGHWPWRGVPMNPETTADIVGDSLYAACPGFASCHRAGVNVAMCDGSVKTLPRSLYWPEMYALCGANDHQVIDLE